MLPNFLVVGAGRSGTTSLHHYLRQHPEVFLPGVKSPSYFYCHRLPPEGGVSRDYFICDPDAYESLFEGVQQERAVGEVSPAYLASMQAISHIAETLPGVKIVMILRNPVDRFYARYVARHRDGLELSESVEALISREREQTLVRDEAVGTYLSAGFCSHFIEAYMARFSRKQLHLTLFDDLQANGAAYMRSLFEFLQVAPDYEVDLSQRKNASGGYIRSPLLRAMWTKSATARQSARPYVPRRLRDALFSRITRNTVPRPLPPAARRELVSVYRSEIERLQSLTDRELAHWMR